VLSVRKIGELNCLIKRGPAVASSALTKFLYVNIGRSAAFPCAPGEDIEHTSRHIARTEAQPSMNSYKDEDLWRSSHLLHSLEFSAGVWI
jgi:hypothetical protein